MHKIALFILFSSTNIQNVLISHYRMYGRFACPEAFRAGAHRAARFYDMLTARNHTLFDILPHKKSPFFRQKILYFYVEKRGIMKNYASLFFIRIV